MTTLFFPKMGFEHTAVCSVGRALATFFLHMRRFSSFFLRTRCGTIFFCACALYPLSCLGSSVGKGSNLQHNIYSSKLNKRWCDTINTHLSETANISCQKHQLSLENIYLPSYKFWWLKPIWKCLCKLFIQVHLWHTFLMGYTANFWLIRFHS